MKRLSFVWLLALSSFTHAVAEETTGLTLERDVRPILKQHCLDCHGATKEVNGGLDLRLVRFMVKGGESGAAIVPGQPVESLLLERIKAGEMPPGEKKVTPEQIAIIEQWIASGAKTARPEPDKIDEGVGITWEEREFWSFQPIKRPQVPEFSDANRVRTPIDALLLAKMKEIGLSFSPDADRVTLIKRLCFDLVGLPPTPEEVAAFVNDRSDGAYEALVDRLLDSPHYGERWARHWLDVAGYADSEGYTNNDADRPWAYFYRDYVIRSLNNDKPFDQFIQEQLAGDELVPLPHKNLSPEAIDKLAATGFLRMAVDGTGSGSNDDTARNQTIADTIKIVSTSLLGLSVGCAQCHDHRYDPIPQKDYYALRAVLEPALDWKAWRTPQQRLVTLYTDDDRAKATAIEAEAQIIAKERAEKQSKYITEALEQELAKHPENLREKLRTAYRTPGDKRSDEQNQLLKAYPSVNISPGNLYQYNQGHADELKKYDQQIDEVRAKKPVEQFLRVLTEVPGKVPETFVFHRGEFQQPTIAVTPASLTIAAPPGERFTIQSNDESLPTSGRRLAYAKWLTNGKHPLVGRVLVNRIWMHHFGRGIVGTPSDFGVLGERPSHPELLDWLASEFVEQGWSLKKLHKLIVTSTAYRQTSVAEPEKLAIDGANALYWKFPVQRLDAEIVRDRILATSGVLGGEMFGAPVNVKADDAGQVLVDGDETRRSIYVRVKRTQPVAMLKAFDAPVMSVNCESRPSSTVAPQSLMLMNSEFILRHAKTFAERARKETKAPIEVDFDLERLQGNGFAWQFGSGRLEEKADRVVDFVELPHFTGSAWQGGPQLPDPKLGFVIVSASGGHPGNKEFASIRRWTAPRDGTLAITGNLGHPSDNGDGVRGTIVSNRNGIAGQWVAKTTGIATTVAAIAVQKGDTIDFVVDCREHETSDSFSWEVSLSLRPDSADAVATTSKAGFHGPAVDVSLVPAQVARAWQLAYCRPASPEELSSSLEFLAAQIDYLSVHGAEEAKADPTLHAMTNLCQVLLSSNEFLYVE
ncbi:MAG: PSD1 domain-containing protein [Planctomycetaceae bacterium]|nr:PSD1 domain-containing protein [Planctomycetales bacterium]MCB9924228.1 PSD1 domain-containing protein [Planctomycetaceae bacterium]